MNKQVTMWALTDELSQVWTKKKSFWDQIERIIPWQSWVEAIKPCYYKGERCNKPYDVGLMLRIYMLQNPYDLADEATVAEVIDSRAFSEFCGVDSSNQVPDGDTLGRFRNILIENDLQEKLFAQVIELLQQRGLLLKKGTIVDSTLIASPSSTKNQEHKRDPEAHQVKKGNAWHFGYKAHIGVDQDSGLVHTVKVTPANVHDVTVTPELLNGEETVVYGDMAILVLTNAMMLCLKTIVAKKSVTKSTVVLPKFIRVLLDPRHNADAENEKNRLSVPRLNTYLRLSSNSFDTEKRDTEV